MTYEKLLKLRHLIHKSSASLDDTDALNGMELFDWWKPNEYYEMGDRRRYGDKLYKCNQAHTSQEIYPPDIVPALWSEISDPSVEWPDWKQPKGAHDAYEKGAKVSHNNKHWISEIDANTYEPGVYGWNEQSTEK